MQKIITLIQLEMQMKQQSYAESAFRGRGSPLMTEKPSNFINLGETPLVRENPPLK